MIQAANESRILQAIAECDAFIAKEGKRAADLRPTSTQQHLDFCIQHKTKLQAMLVCSNCGGDGGHEKELSSTTGTWVLCPACSHGATL